MPGLLSAVSSLATVLSGLGLVGSLFKPLPPLVDGLQGVLGPTINPLLQPLGLALVAAPNGTVNANPPTCIVEPYQVSAPTITDFPPFDKDLATIYRYRQQQSTNLGGWYVLESWMTPSLFTCAAGNKTSELDVAGGWGTPDNVKMLLERHWDAFITEDDFRHMAAIGINTIRLPIGYWALPSTYLTGTSFEPHTGIYTNLWPRIVQTIITAAKYNIGVLVDLHGAPGSQNALPSSGEAGSASLWTDSSLQAKAVLGLTFLATQLSQATNVVGLQLLNEPNAQPDLEAFYDSTIASLRAVSPNVASLPIYIHDAFDIGRFARYVSQRSDFVVLDHHSYFVFSPSDADAPVTQATNDVGAGISDALLEASVLAKRNMIVGEFSCAVSNDSLAKAEDPVAARKLFCTTQMQAYANVTAGWYFWSWTEEQCAQDPAWCMQTAIGHSLPASFASYPGAEPRNNTVSGKTSAVSQSLQSAISAITPPSLQSALGTALNGTSAAVGTVAGVADSASQAVGTLKQKRTSMWSRHLLHGTVERRTHPRSWAVSNTQPRRRDSSSATALGYSDGFSAARTFASHGLSKIGFVNQYISDTFAAHVAAGQAVATDSPGYQNWFAQGQSDAEALIMQAIQASNAGKGM